MVPLGTVLLLSLAAVAGGDGPTLALEPRAAIIGETTVIVVRVRPGAALPAALSVVVEAGSVTALEPGVDGTLTAAWTLPALSTPRRYAAALVDHRRGSVDFAALALSRRAQLDTESFPDSSVRVALDGKPVTTGVTDGEGRVKLSLLVPAGAAGRVTVEHLRGQAVVHREELALGTTDTVRVWSLALADATGAVTLHAHAYRDSGRPVEGLEVNARAGEAVTRLAPRGDGVFSGALATGGADPVWISFADSEGADQRTQATQVLLRPAPGSLRLSLRAVGGVGLDSRGNLGAALHGGVGLGHRMLPPWLELVADTGAVAWPGSDGRGPELDWEVSLVAGARVTWAPHPRWTLALASAGGARLVGSERASANRGVANKSAARLTVDGLIALWGEAGVSLGPGLLLVGLRGDLAPSPSPDAGWGTMFGVVGYRVGWGVNR
jgi:hypothetical protein